MISDNLSQMLRKKILHYLPLLSSLSIEEVSLKPQATKWSKKEVIGHLIDSAINNSRRVIIAQQQDHLLFDGYNQDVWVAASGYQDRDWYDVIDTWSRMNHHFSQIILQIPLVDMEKERIIHNYHLIGFKNFEPDQVVTLRDLIVDYVDHIDHHLNHIT